MRAEVWNRKAGNGRRCRGRSRTVRGAVDSQGAEQKRRRGRATQEELGVGHEEHEGRRGPWVRMDEAGGVEEGAEDWLGIFGQSML